MRPNLIAFAISLALLTACSTTRNDREAATAATDEVNEVHERQDADSATVVGFDAATRPAPEVVAAGAVSNKAYRARNEASAPQLLAQPLSPPPPPVPMMSMAAMPGLVALQDKERYAGFDDNRTTLSSENSVSTFSIDVDTGSYSNVRRMLMAGQRPPADAVRAEEMLNYFDYGYAAPTSRATPFRVSTEIAVAPWNSKHHLLQIGIQGYRVPKSQVPASNLVFLIDTSGSMQDEDKLPLLRESYKELARQLRPQDRVAIVVYAGSAGLVLPPTPGDQQEVIIEALERLSAGGSTNGGEGLKLAYAMARQAFIKDGVNRVILATDGDFNVGTFDQKALETMIADQRESGIALTTLGFGTGNYNDAMAEQLADIGNGNHAYIDSLNEGRKVLVEELSSTMMTIAQDVKIQVEFNPAVVAEYRLIGYENRALNREDFNNDKVDAGEIGAGHDVTALYEITLVGSGGESVDPLRYGRSTASASAKADEIGLLKLRYKQPGASTSQLLETTLKRSEIRANASGALRWSAAVAAYADLLRGGTHVGSFGWDEVQRLASTARGEDRWGHRAEFLQLIDRARSITRGETPVAVSE